MSGMPLVGTPPETPPAASPRRRRVSRLTKRDKVVLSVMVGIPVLIEAVLIWFPTVASVALSFFSWNGLALSDIKSAGGSNYSYVVHNYPPFWPAVRHNILWLVFLGVVGTPLGLLFAVLLDQQIRGSKIYQSVFFIPVMMSLALVGVIWQLMYSQNQGFINGFLGSVDHGYKNNPVDWLGNSSINIWAALVAATWKHAGYIMILYLAGLKGIDPSLKEAAAIDGANGRQTFFRVVFPAMRPINIVIVVITIIEALRAFDIVYVINKGTNGLELLSALIIQNLVGEGQVIGVGSALATILLIVSLIPIVTYLILTFRKENR